mmetsp:Transcript_21697/g.51259  ORF Transcript_21697/g.51259 Transcript_21697/m.51259 type:complete len:201 (+) Transcript_21697:374-976(+)
MHGADGRGDGPDGHARIGRGGDLGERVVLGGEEEPHLPVAGGGRGARLGGVALAVHGHGGRHGDLLPLLLRILFRSLRIRTAATAATLHRHRRRHGDALLALVLRLRHDADVSRQLHERTPRPVILAAALFVVGVFSGRCGSRRRRRIAKGRLDGVPRPVPPDLVRDDAGPLPVDRGAVEDDRVGRLLLALDAEHHAHDD